MDINFLKGEKKLVFWFLDLSIVRKNYQRAFLVFKFIFFCFGIFNCSDLLFDQMGLFGLSPIKTFGKTPLGFTIIEAGGIYVIFYLIILFRYQWLPGGRKSIIDNKLRENIKLQIQL